LPAHSPTIVPSTFLEQQALHAVHDASVIEKALLMLVLGLAYCKGNPKHDGSRWIHDKDLYYYLHAFDENIPAEPPTTGGRGTSTKKRFTPASQIGDSAVSHTPDVDVLLEKFVKREHLVKARATEDQVLADAKVELESCFYAMGPRSALEVGRKQVVYFCADVLGVKPDAAMLKEIEADEDDNNSGGGGGGLHREEEAVEH
jgi:MAGE family